MFDRVLVANRGEIAVRVIAACHELGIEAVAVHSEADTAAKHVRHADEAVHIGPAKVQESYLDVDAVLDAARETDVDAIHPGYGLLAENESFAAAVESADFVWVGPPSSVMADFGEKTRARRIMAQADVPVVPGTDAPVDGPEAVREFGAEHGYPVAVKADGGGGGHGLKVARSPEEVAETVQEARQEGEAFFDNAAVYVERFLENPRHVEVQILADTHGNVRHLGERDCSVQRRQQKLIEETPCPVIDDETRNELYDAACRGAAEAGYVNAGTVEFLYDDGAFYFIEVNARIQVEHTITEAVTGKDIVKWQLKIAAGEPIEFSQTEISLDRSAMEFRINAEDPAADFAPMPGTVETYRPPRGIGVRVDDGIDEGDDVSPYYDSLVGKFVVTGEDRAEVIARGRRALRDAEVSGIPTTIPFHHAVLDDPLFIQNDHGTRYVDDHFEGL